MSHQLRLSKSRIVKGLQCPKLLYLTMNKPELAEEVSDAQQMIFDQGHEVGLEAQKRFPGGVLITASHTEHELAIHQTTEAILRGALAIFEATFEYDDVLVKIDILKRESPEHSWEILEVKSSTSVKEVHVQDAAVQLWVARHRLHEVESASIMYINNQCTYPNLEDLFLTEDVTEEAEAFMKKLPKHIKRLREAVESHTPPRVGIGEHCDDPYECAFKTHCWTAAKVIPPSVFNVPGLRTEKKWELHREGKTQLKKLEPEDFSAIQARMIDCTEKNIRFVDKVGISKALKEWEFPLSFLDFETINTAIPRYKGVRSYQQLPFQFSCHIRRKPGGKLEHGEYLHGDDSDPRRAVAEALCRIVPAKGSIVAYSKGVEGGVLRKLAEEFPDLKKPLISMADRLVDPLPIFKGHTYDPAYCGSFSIKDVAPALLGKAASYKDMEVGDGGAAQAAYLAMLRPDTPKAGREKMRWMLTDYCTKDTLGMVQLVDWLFEQVGAK